nr:MAG TPA: hypothetical protein [Caudoviricetes sp.]
MCISWSTIAEPSCLLTFIIPKNLSFMFLTFSFFLPRYSLI